jgi:hypothetical protein
LTYVADEDMLAGLSWNASPPQVLDGVAVRTAVGTASRDHVVAHLAAPLLDRYQGWLNEFSGARFLVSAGEDSVPRRLVMTFTGNSANPTVELQYTEWATTSVSIEAPSGPEVLVRP